MSEPVKISVIIPALNEAESISSVVRGVLCDEPDVEVIVADGGSTDSTVDAAERSGALVVQSRPGRGAQMDAGSAQATGEVLLFLHADTKLPSGWREMITGAVAGCGTAGGGFGLRIDSGRPVFRVIEFVVGLRSRHLGLIYGDQAIFARRENFIKAGGYKSLPLMEDVDFVRRLARTGRLALLPAKAATSARRWEKYGVVNNTFRNWLFLTLYYLGVSPNRLYAWYYGQPGL